MGKSMEQVVGLMRQRRTQDAVLIQAMIENRDRYNADVVVVQPDVSTLPAANRPGPNFFQEGVDGHARIANQTLPKIYTPVKNPESDSQKALSARRQGALYGAWYDTQLHLKMDRLYRHLAAYGTMALVVMADDHLGRADIQIRDPLTAYPELRAPDDIRPPADCGFLFARSAKWIISHFPNAPKFLTDGGKGWDTLWDVVEWIDEEDVIMGVMGPRFPAYGYADARPYGANAFELARWTNQSGVCSVVVPRRATLDRIMGQLTAMINYSDLYARMLSLQLVSTEKNIFPDMVVMGRTGLPPQLVGGQWFDGRTGKVNIVIDGAVEMVGKESGPGTIPMLQLIDQHIRGGTGANPLYGGNAGQMRTGAGVDALGDFSTNPIVAESQRTMQMALSSANSLWMGEMVAHYGDKPFTTIMGLSGSPKTISYTPAKDFKELDNVVQYTAPGADINKYAVALTQLASTDLISKHTARDKHPLIDDPDLEDQLVAIEKMTDATLAAFANETAQGAPGMTAQAARATELTAGGMPAYKALLQAASESASQGPAPGTPGGPTPPPGPGGGGPIPPGLAQMLAAQGAGPSQSAGAAVPPPNPGLMNLRHVLQGVNEQVSPGAS